MKATILTVHQDDDDRRNIHETLSNFDFDLIYADDGLSGFQAAKYLRPDLIICEVKLKLLDGISMVKMIRKDKTIADSSILFLHEELDLKYINAAKRLSTKAFLIKPYIDNSLIYAVKKSLEREELTTHGNEDPTPYEQCQLDVKGDSKCA